MTMHMNEVPFLKARIEELEEEIRQLKQDLRGPDNVFVGQFTLTPQMSALLWTIYKSDGMVTNARLDLVTREYGQPSRWRDGDCDYSAVTKVRISNIRRKIERLGVSIINVHNVGYYMTYEDKQKLAKALENKDGK
jgi:DNA-binding response OmpR family regulator